ncbi:hypothetical protein FSP39_015983 [Pinctada imbricata]|uniref:SWIM-type domain-containing protein n=1 Tax=Pinctada imbricata TaxID=66713 RepID=A0AA88YXE9_PINIB|nr:hypothetical protein FSP39_015983 [Pinctada imbricata]
MYEGDEKIYTPLAHGNAKHDKEQEFVRTCKSVLNEIKQSKDKPMITYRKLVCKEGVEGPHHGVLNPRNLRQIKNHQASQKANNSLGKDDIYNIVQLAHHLKGFVGEITVYPDLIAVFALPEIMDTFQELIQSNASSPVCLVYDTTFNLGDFYVSPLVFRHVLFEQTPWIPLAFLIHERKQQKCHNRLFEFVADKVPILKTKSLPFITDREPALTKSVQFFFPNLTVLHCWNHVRRDFKEELRKQTANPSEMAVYLNQWKTMSQCETEDEFHSVYDDLTSSWTTSVKQYFDKHIKPDILMYSGRWLIEKFNNLYDPYSGVTNNPSESINSVLKRMTGWQELPVDSMMLSLYFLQNFYQAEIQRGRAGIGNYRLKARYREAKLDKDELHIPNKIIAPDRIIEYVKSASADNLVPKANQQVTAKDSANDEESAGEATGAEHNVTVKDLVNDGASDSEEPLSCTPIKANVDDSSDMPITPSGLVFGGILSGLDSDDSPDQNQATAPNYKNMTQRTMAKFVVDNGNVTHVPDCNAFVVTGNKGQKYCVTLNPETCQCPSASTCYHIIAVKMFVGLEIEDKKTEVSLRTLSKRSLKRSDKKSGRKKPRINDTDPVIIPAPDSILNTPKQPHVDSKTPKSKKKLRFASETSTCKSPKVLPAKKRIALREPDADSHKRWVGRLNTGHKDNILNKNGDLCSDIMDTVQNILSTQFPEMNGLMSTSFAPIWVEGENRWRNEKPFQEVSSPAAQIHHTGKHHWVTTVKCENDQIFLLDSLVGVSGELSPSLEIQLAAMYGLGKTEFPVKVPLVQQQNNSHDCGLHAIANLVEFCFNRFTRKQNVIYNQIYLREHLIYCLERQMFVPFPKIPPKSKINKKRVRSVRIPCDCRCNRPNCMEEMIGCDWSTSQCDVWRHRSCTNKTDAETDWYCSPHRN